MILLKVRIYEGYFSRWFTTLEMSVQKKSVFSWSSQKEQSKRTAFVDEHLKRTSPFGHLPSGASDEESQLEWPRFVYKYVSILLKRFGKFNGAATQEDASVRFLLAPCQYKWKTHEENGSLTRRRYWPAFSDWDFFYGNKVVFQEAQA